MRSKDQIRDEKLRYDINRKAAKISAKPSGKFYKYEYVTGEDILPSNQQQIIEQARFIYSPLGKAFEKQIKTIEDQGKKQVDALQSLKLKEKRKPIEDKSYKQEQNINKFNELINKRKELMGKLYDSVGYNNLNFKYVDPKDINVSFQKHINSKQLFNAIKNSKIELNKMRF